MGAVRIAVALVAALVVAQPALALPPGVFIDPGSPAGKEYSFPLSVLRGSATGHAAPAGAPEPLFGAGIHPQAHPSTATTRALSRTAGHHRRTRHASHAAARATARAAAGATSGRRRGETVLAGLARPSSDVLQIALIAVVLLLVPSAFGAGIAAARRRR
jgi:hypothetical protein